MTENHDTFLFHIQSGAIVRDVLQATDKARSVLTLASAARVPAGLEPEKAAEQFVASFYDSRCVPEWARAGQQERTPSPKTDGAATRRASVLYDRYAPILNAVLIRITRNETLSERLLVEVLATAARDAQSCRLASLVEAVRAAALPHAPAAPASPSEDMSANGAAPPVWNRLAPRQRAVMERAFFEGKKVREIAEECGAPVAWVREALCRGLAGLMTPVG